MTNATETYTTSQLADMFGLNIADVERNQSEANATMDRDVTTMSIRDLITEYWALFSTCITPAVPGSTARCS